MTLKFNKHVQLFVGMHNGAPSAVAVRVNNPESTA